MMLGHDSAAAERFSHDSRIVERTADVVDRNRDDRFRYALKNGKKFVQSAIIEENLEHLAEQVVEKQSHEVDSLLSIADVAAKFLRDVPGDEAEILRSELEDAISLFRNPEPTEGE